MTASGRRKRTWNPASYRDSNITYPVSNHNEVLTSQGPHGTLEERRLLHKPIGQIKGLMDLPSEQSIC